MRAFAYGYTSHKEVWGADYTAHHNSCPTSGIGYVIAQSAALVPTVAVAIGQILLANQIDPAQVKLLAAQFVPSVAHDAVETAIDVLIKLNEDPVIGARMLAAAQLRSPTICVVLVTAYTADFAREFGLNIVETTKIIIGAEKVFREIATSYGYIFTKNEFELIQLLSVYAAELAAQFMKAATGLDITVPVATMVDLLNLAINQVAPSYANEVAAT